MHSWRAVSYTHLDVYKRQGWDSATPSLARWNAVKYANTYRVVLYDDQGSVVSQLVEGSTEYDFSPFKMCIRDRC